MSFFDELNQIIEPALNRPEYEIHPGVSIATVTSLNDPDNLGRIKCKLVNMPDEAAGDLGWAFTASPLAGEQRGVFFLPNVGDMVLVAFEDGDVSRPFVIGSIWGGSQTPPVKISDGKNESYIIKTPRKNTITLSDTENKESITVETPKGQSIAFNDEKSTITLNDKDGNNSIIIDTANGNISIKCQNKLTLSAGNQASITLDGTSGNINISGGQKISLGGVQIDIEAQGTATLKASAQLSAESDGVMTIKGGMVKIN